MAFDAGMLRCVVWELSKTLRDGKVEKITQPSADEVGILIRAGGENHRLCLRGGSNMPRLSLTSQAKENPAVPPMFCMLLRKHLGGAKLLGVEQIGYERIARLSFSGYDEMGYPTQKHLVAEVMGKYSNLILLNDDNRILGVLRAVDFSTSRVRQLLPGMQYELPPPQEKRLPLEETKEAFLAALNAEEAETPADRFLVGTYLGTSLQVAREIVYAATGHSDTRLYATAQEKLWDAFSAWFESVRSHEYAPSLMLDQNGTVLDFCYRPLTYFGPQSRVKAFSTPSQLLDACFSTRERGDRMRQRSADLLGILDRAEGRIRRKLQAQREEYDQAAKGEEWQRMGDLLTANLWRVSRGDTVLETEDFYEENTPLRRIPLDERLTGAQNAQRYYKWYTKAKHAREYLSRQMELGESELKYLESVRSFLDRATSETDLTEIREELYRAGYASRMKGYSSPKQMKLLPREYTSPAGYKVLVGRNNMQNDKLTFQTAAKGDLWFHVKGMAGSHVILLCNGEEPPAEDYTFAASLAAHFSEAKGSGVPVDYTRVKFVKKPPAAKPGYVTYSTNYTAYVSCDVEVEE